MMMSLQCHYHKVVIQRCTIFWYECDIINLVMMSWYYYDVIVMSVWHHITLRKTLTATCCTRLWLITIKVITVLKLSRWKYVPNYSCTPQHLIPFRCQQLMWLSRSTWEKGHLERYSRGQSRDPHATPKSLLCWSTPLEFLLPSSSWKVSCELQTHN